MYRLQVRYVGLVLEGTSQSLAHNDLSLLWLAAIDVPSGTPNEWAQPHLITHNPATGWTQVVPTMLVGLHSEEGEGCPGGCMRPKGAPRRGSRGPYEPLVASAGVYALLPCCVLQALLSPFGNKHTAYMPAQGLGKLAHMVQNVQRSDVHWDVCVLE